MELYNLCTISKYHGTDIELKEKSKNQLVYLTIGNNQLRYSYDLLLIFIRESKGNILIPIVTEED